MEIELVRLRCSACKFEDMPWEFQGELGGWPYRECPKCSCVDVRMVVERLALGVSAPVQD
jgi:hypothetical protein